MYEKEVVKYLKDNLTDIDRSLKPIKTEYSLIGKKMQGSVDILATDKYDNYVIIEVKVSKNSSRSTLQEILKYALLVQELKGVKPSKVRIIIVSTDWTEIQYTFSYLKSHCDFLIEGIKITWDKELKMIAEYENILFNEERQQAEVAELADLQHIFLYSTLHQAKSSLPIIKKRFSNYVKDFLVIETHKENLSVMFPYGIIIILKAYNEDFYTNLILDNMDYDADDLLEEKEGIFSQYEEFADIAGDEEAEIINLICKEHYLYTLHQILLGEIISGINSDDFEICSPEKVKTMIFNQNWIIDEIHKYGVFETEARGDDWFKKVITGIKENNFYIFEDNFRTDQDYSDNKENLYKFASNYDELTPILDFLFDELNNIDKILDVDVRCYNNKDILYSLSRLPNNIGYLPEFIIEVNTFDKSTRCVYMISLLFDGRYIELESIILKFFHNDRFRYFVDKISHEIEHKDSELLKALGLHFTMIKVTNDGAKYIGISENHQYDIEDFIQLNRNFILQLQNMMNNYVFEI